MIIGGKNLEVSKCLESLDRCFVSYAVLFGNGFSNKGGIGRMSMECRN